jgi:hypothetical protein
MEIQRPDEIWRTSLSPYIITKNTTIYSNLVIESGVIVKLDCYCSIVFYGQLSVFGTEASPVEFIALNQSDCYWGQLKIQSKFGDNKVSKLYNMIVSGGGQVYKYDSNSSSITTSGAVLFDGVSIVNPISHGLYIDIQCMFSCFS